MKAFKDNKRYLLFILLLQLFMGIYIALIRQEFYEPQPFDVMFFYAREGLYINFEDRQFDFQVILSILDLLITIPLISSILSKDYVSKCSYIATRAGSFGKFYFKDTANKFIYCFFCGVFYSAGITIVSFFTSNKSLAYKNSLVLIAFSVFAYAIVLFTMAQIGSLLSVLFNEKTGMIISTTLFLISSFIIFFFPIPLKQWNFVVWYFVGVFEMENVLFSYSPYVYYIIAAVADGLIYLIGYKTLKKKDIL